MKRLDMVEVGEKMMEVGEKMMEVGVEMKVEKTIVEFKEFFDA